VGRIDKWDGKFGLRFRRGDGVSWTYERATVSHGGASDPRFVRSPWLCTASQIAMFTTANVSRRYVQRMYSGSLFSLLRRPTYAFLAFFFFGVS
jgi:hypothetical protein